MKQSNNLNDPLFLAPLLERFFIDRLMRQRDVSPHTVASYRDSFRLLLSFALQRLGLAPAQLLFEQIDAPLVTEFLEDLEVTRNVSVRTRNLRLTAVRSFFRYASYELFPAHATQIQRVLAIPDKRFERKQIGFLSRDQVDALLQAPDRTTWTGRRDHAFILTAVQTGLRVSELTALKREDMIMGVSSHVRVIGKGRKRRCTPLAKPTCAVLNAWMSEPERGHQNILFPSINGEQLTVHGVQHLLKKHQATAQTLCPSLKHQRVTVHLLRHTAAMELLHAGVDRTTMALWLGHEDIQTTQVYIEATLKLKEAALAKTTPHHGKPQRFKPDDSLLAFLSNL